MFMTVIGFCLPQKTRIYSSQDRFHYYVKIDFHGFRISSCLVNCCDVLAFLTFEADVTSSRLQSAV